MWRRVAGGSVVKRNGVSPDRRFESTESNLRLFANQVQAGCKIFLVCGHSQGQFDRDLQTAFWPVASLYRAIVQTYGLAGNCQSETGTSTLARPPRISAKKRLEDIGQHRFRDAWTRVADFDNDL